MICIQIIIVIIGITGSVRTFFYIFGRFEYGLQSFLLFGIQIGVVRRFVVPIFLTLDFTHDFSKHGKLIVT
ncbi:hypothetical protein DESC_280008 [Desulfosarcina cetonica]|nr:hypothetical protein DESC_280008 [Desulfosarcina cetonica]